MSQSERCHGQGGVTVKVVSQSRCCHSQSGVTVEVVSQSRWCHSQGSITDKVVSQARWCHSQGGVIVKVVSQSSGGCPNPKFRLFQSSDFPKSGSARFGGNQQLDGSISRSPLYPCMTNDVHVSIATSHLSEA